MNLSDRKSPRISITLLFGLLAVISFLGITSAASRNAAGFNALGNIFILMINIGFWGLVYRVSKHVQFYFNGRPGGSFIRIIVVASFVVAFIFLFSYVISFFQNPSSTVHVDEDPYAALRSQIESKRASDH